MELRTVEQKVVVCVCQRVCVCVCDSVWTAWFLRPDSVRLVTSLLHHTSTEKAQPAHRLSQPITLDGQRKRREKRSDVEEGGWEERRGEDEDEEEEKGGRDGQGLSVEKTAMKGNCHAPVLAQEHLSQGEHAKCAGHVLTIPSPFCTHRSTHPCKHTLSHTQVLR